MSQRPAMTVPEHTQILTSLPPVRSGPSEACLVALSYEVTQGPQLHPSVRCTLPGTLSFDGLVWWSCL